MESFDQSTIVKRAHPQPGVDLTYIKQTGESNGDGGDQYTGLDRFGRVVDQRWIVTANGSHTDRFQYGYDRDNNRLYRSNLVNHAFDELYHASGACNGYDQLNQLTAFARGTLSDTNSDGVPDTVASASRSQSWTFDALGNWSSLTTNGTAVNRTHNQQNETTAVGASSLAFDHNGNTTTDDQGNTLVYDAWNRLVQVKNAGGSTLASYAFDALGRRVLETSGGSTRDLYFTSASQVVEERVGGTTTTQYVWGAAYVNELVERDRDADGNPANGLEERLYVQQDGNWNVTALISTAGTVLERYAYDPFGAVTYLTAAWGVLSGSAYAARYLFQGGRVDPATGLYFFQRRDFSPRLGRWAETDPLGFRAGDPNFYAFVHNTPENRCDPTGLWSWTNCWIAGGVALAVVATGVFVIGTGGLGTPLVVAIATTGIVATGVYAGFNAESAGEAAGMGVLGGILTLTVIYTAAWVNGRFVPSGGAMPPAGGGTGGLSGEAGLTPAQREITASLSRLREMRRIMGRLEAAHERAIERNLRVTEQLARQAIYNQAQRIAVEEAWFEFLLGGLP